MDSEHGERQQSGDERGEHGAAPGRRSIHPPTRRSGDEHVKMARAIVVISRTGMLSARPTNGRSPGTIIRNPMPSLSASPWRTATTSPVATIDAATTGIVTRPSDDLLERSRRTSRARPNAVNGQTTVSR